MTLLSMIQDAADELTLSRPASVISSTDQTARTLLAHANREGQTLVKAFKWTILNKVHTFVTVNGTEEYALPSDYDRLVADTEWDRANTWPLIGPLNGVEWQTIKSGSIGSGAVGRRYRVVRASSGNTRKIYVDPVPDVDDDTLAFEYVSNGWCASAAGTPQTVWTADDDVSILDEMLMKLGIQVRYLRGRGLDYAGMADEYMLLFEALKGQDRPSRTLSLTPRRYARILNLDNVPETGYGS
jgi:hypothetical protein